LAYSESEFENKVMTFEIRIWI